MTLRPPSLRITWQKIGGITPRTWNGLVFPHSSISGVCVIIQQQPISANAQRIALHRKCVCVCIVAKCSVCGCQMKEGIPTHTHIAKITSKHPTHRDVKTGKTRDNSVRAISLESEIFPPRIPEKTISHFLPSRCRYVAGGATEYN